MHCYNGLGQETQSHGKVQAVQARERGWTRSATSV